MALILPQMGHPAVWEAAERDCKAHPQWPSDNPPHTGFATVIENYVCPHDGRSFSPLQDKDGITAAYTSYLGVRGGYQFDGVLGMPAGQRGISIGMITDGTSQTLMVGERPPPDTLQAGWWYTAFRYVGVYKYYGPDGAWEISGPSIGLDPCQGPFPFGPGRPGNPCDRYHFWSYHRGGANFLMADSTARFFSYSVRSIMVPLATRDGGEVIDLP